MKGALRLIFAIPIAIITIVFGLVPSVIGFILSFTFGDRIPAWLVFFIGLILSIPWWFYGFRISFGDTPSVVPTFFVNTVLFVGFTFFGSHCGRDFRATRLKKSEA